MKEQLTHAQRDAIDAAYRRDLRALPRMMGGFSPEALAEQVRIGTLMRRIAAKHYPHLRAAMNALPELEQV